MADTVNKDSRPVNVAEAAKRSLWSFLNTKQTGTPKIAPLIREGGTPLADTAAQIQTSKIKTEVVTKP